MNGVIAEIRGFAANFAPRAWALCDGQLLAISSNTALFSLIGTIYGGDGRTSFALPDLRGRNATHSGNGPGLSSYTEGERGGSEDVTLTNLNLPSHTHYGVISVVDADGPERRPGGKYLAGDVGATLYSNGPLASPPATLASDSLTVHNSGSQRKFSLVNPYTCVNQIICMQGIYPSRS